MILGYTPVSEAENLAEYDISQAVFSLEYAKELSENVLKRIVSAKCTSRLTRECQESALCVRSSHGMNILLKKFARLVAFRILRLRAFTHFCVSDEDAEGREFTNKQYENFIHVRDSLKREALISALFIAQTAVQLKITPKPVAIW